MKKNLLKLFYYKIRFWLFLLTFLSIGIEFITYRKKASNNLFYINTFGDIKYSDLCVISRILPFLSIVFTIIITIMLLTYMNHKSENDFMISSPYTGREIYLSSICVSLLSTLFFVLINYSFILTVTCISKGTFAIITDNLWVIIRFYLGTFAGCLIALGLISLVISVSETIRGAISKLILLTIAGFLLYTTMMFILETDSVHFASDYFGGIFNIKYNIYYNSLIQGNEFFTIYFVNIKGILLSSINGLILIGFGFALYKAKYKSKKYSTVSRIINNIIKYITMLSLLSLLTVLIKSLLKENDKLLFSITLFIIFLTIVCIKGFNNFIYHKEIYKNTIIDTGISVILVLVLYFGISGYAKIYDDYSPNASDIKYIQLHCDDGVWLEPISYIVSNTKITDSELIKDIINNVNEFKQKDDNNASIVIEFNNGITSTYRSYEFPSYIINRLENEIYSIADSDLKQLPDYNANCAITFYAKSKTYKQYNLTDISSKELSDLFNEYQHEFDSLDSKTKSSILKNEFHFEYSDDTTFMGFMEYYIQDEKSLTAYRLPVYSETPKSCEILKQYLSQ